MLKIHQYFFRTFVLILLVLLVSLSLVIYFWFKSIYINQVKSNLVQNIDTLSSSVDSTDNLNSVMIKLKKQLKLRITVIDLEGNVIAESDEGENPLANYLEEEEIVQARESSVGIAIRTSNKSDEKLIFVAKKVQINNQTYFVRMADYTDKIIQEFSKLLTQIFILITFFSVISFLTTYLISLKIKRETEAILDFLMKLSTKRPSYYLRLIRTFEFYKIAKLLNKVAAKLAKKEKQKLKQTAKLKHANKQKDEIISALSHEFKNPIAIISGYTETILNDNEMPLAIKTKFLNKIYSNSLKMSHIIDKLRLTLKLEEGKQELILAPYSMKKIIEVIISDLKDNYKNRIITIEGEDTSLKVDETLISMAISNLIENALKYSEEEIIVRITNNSISVIDKGIGISQKDLVKINQKFYRVSKNGWNNSLGLGLFIVHNIISLHNFSLEVNSEFGKSSEFKILY